MATPVQKQFLKFVNPEADPNGIWRVAKLKRNWSAYIINYENTKTGVDYNADAYDSMVECMNYIMQKTNGWTTPPDFSK